MLRFGSLGGGVTLGFSEPLDVAVVKYLGALRSLQLSLGAPKLAIIPGQSWPCYLDVNLGHGIKKQACIRL